MSAKYYVYRNLYKNSFSVKYRGIVIHRPKTCILEDVEFKVSEVGRKRVLKEKRKNVHATVAGSIIKNINEPVNIEDYEEIYYNPYKVSTFVDSSGAPIHRAKNSNM